MPSGRLNLYRFIEDAWSGGLCSWCEQPGESWLLVENAGQARWLSRKLAGARIRIFDADELREELALLAGIDPPPRHRTTATFAIKVAGGEAAMRNAAALADACDALARAGWHLNQLAIDPAIAQRIHKTMERAGDLAGIFDRRLREALPSQPVRLCCIGWDAAHWPDLGLLDLAASKTGSFEMYVPSPRLPADALQQQWIEALETHFSLERATCPESGFASENESLVRRLENSSREEARPPLLLVGREWQDQVGLVCDQVTTWLAENPTPPIGIVAPEDSPTAVAIAEALEHAGVSVEHPGRMREPPPPHLILEQMAQYHLNSHDVDDLLELAIILWHHQREARAALDPESVRDALDRAFRTAQSRNARILAQALPRRTDAAWAALCKLIDALGRWDADFPWTALREKWSALLSALSLPADALLPPPSALFQDEPIPGRLFMEWVAEELAARRRDIPAPDYAQPAPVVVTTFAGAAQQTWDRLILLDSNEHSWPAPIAENPFLPDASRIHLNRIRGDSALLLTTRDLRALDQAHFLDLLEQTRGSVAFAGVLLEHTDAGDRAQPNEWVLRALLEIDSYTPNLWTESARVRPPQPPPALDAPERIHLETVHASRQNGTIPFDRYLFNFNETKLETAAWSATDLDDAITCPATFALRELFAAAAPQPFTRAEAAAVGSRAHRWLGAILGLRDHLAAPEPPAGDEAKLARELSAARRELEQWYSAEDIPMPIWWETCLRKTAWAARRCLREVRGCLDTGYCAMEQALAVTVRTPAGSLLLKGRIDILISDRPEIADAHIRMFDFKTGRGSAPTLTSIGRGPGAQFAAYYLMARDAGAASAVIGIIKPEERARDIFTAADEESLRARFGVFADLQHTLRFGRQGPLVDEHAACEALPMATVPIDPAILEQKAALFLLA